MKAILVSTITALGYCACMQAEQVHRLAPPIAGEVTNWWTFGTAVALEGSYAVVGAPNESPGCAYIYNRLATNWVQQARLTAPADAIGKRYAEAVTLAEDYAMVGAWEVSNSEGRVYVYHRTGTNWSLHTTLAPSTPGVGELFGASLAAQGDLLVVGAPNAHPGVGMPGAAYAFRRKDSVWAQEARLRIETTTDPEIFEFARGVDVCHNTIAVLSRIQPPKDAFNRFAVYLYQGVGTNWQVKTRLNPSQPGPGNSTSATGFALTTNTVMTGELYGTNASGIFCGLTYVFERPAAGWGATLIQTESAILSGPDGRQDDWFGAAVALDGDIAVVGTPRHFAQDYRGETYVFLRTNGAWALHSRLRPSDACLWGTGFGSVYALDQGRFLAGAPTAYVAGEQTGCAYVFNALCPGPPFNPTPYSGEQQIGLNSWLSWSNGNTTTSIDLLFNLGATPTNKVLNNVAPVTTFNPGPLEGNRAYSWQVVCRSVFGVTEGPVWRFSTVGPLDFQVSPADLAFGGLLTNAVSAVRNLSIHNPGARAINLSLSLTNSAFWMRPQSQGAPTGFVRQLQFPLEVGATTMVSVAFAPTNVAAFADVMLLRTTDAGWDKYTNLVTLSGEGLRSLAGAPSQPVPPNGATSVPLRPTLQWKNGAGTDTIDLRFAAAGEHMQNLLRDATPVTNYALPDLAFDTEYTWQVRCRNVAGVTPGPVWTFRTLAPPQFTVTSPEGGESWRVGTAHAIQWKSENASATVGLELWSLEPSPQLVALIATSTPNDGEFEWTVDPHIAPDRFYCVRVKDGSYPAYYGQSRGLLTLTPTIHVVYPNGGEPIRAGAPCAITWLGTGLGGQVNVQILQNGRNYQSLGRKPNTGSLVWNVPCDLEARGFQAYVEWMEDGTFNDLSDEVFDVVILPPDRPSNPSPADRAEGVSRTPTLTWSNLVGACEVQLWLGLNDPPEERIYAGVVTNRFIITKPLRPEAAHYWRVVTRNEAGATNGPVWRFLTRSAIDAPRLATPARQGNNLELQWAPIEAGTQYRLESTTNVSGAFTELIVVQTNRYVHTNALGSPWRFYRVRSQ